MHTQEEQISSSDYARLRELIYQTAGIALGPDRKTMLGSRIARRLKTLNMGSHAEYCKYLFGAQGQRDELVHLIDVVTTNKTDFFRESAHFDYLVATALPRLTAANTSGRPLLFWSAGCSTGEEPYTLAMVLSEYAEKHPGFRFRIMATDISTTVLEKANRAVFTTQVVAPVPASMRSKYLMRSRKPGSHEVRVVPELRKLVEFRWLNFMDEDYGVEEKADGIFCRNVIIYFDRATQERILGKLVSHLVPGGYLFVGHAETLHDMHLAVSPVAPALYRRDDD
jgi:chemotaxis protein methyltransferase CheR